jgi:MYXO-CTERM domain-containing protein
VSSAAFANTTPQALPFSQDWTNTGLITTNDNWDNVPGVIGYAGDGLVASGNDPQTVVAGATGADVLANQTAVSSTVGGVGEFQITNPVVGLQGSGTADSPHLVITVSTTGIANVRVRYNLRDIDGSNDNAIQPVALQYRLGTSGNFTNVAVGFVADATSGPNLATVVTPVDVMMPAAVGNQAVVQIRIITADAQGSDEWVGIDDISVTNATTDPTAVGLSTPASEDRGGAVTFTAAVTPGALPSSTALAVVCDLSPIGGGATQSLFDDGTSGDNVGGDNTFSFATTIGNTTPAGAKSLMCTVSDAETRSSTFSIALTVNSVCGDGIVEGTEACDDDDLDPADGCSATCTIESGYACTGMPSTCTDIDECTTNVDDCSPSATCTNSIGSFSCACNAGFTGGGHGVSGCTDIDECTAATDDCATTAVCANTAGTFTCTCPTGFTGDGRTTGTSCADIDECANASSCDENASCSNSAGSFTCTCDAGFTGNGMTCADADECTLGTDNCDENSICKNLPMTFSCSCAAGFTGDGVTCTPIDLTMPEDEGGCCSSSTDPGGVLLLVLVVAGGLRRRRDRRA